MINALYEDSTSSVLQNNIQGNNFNTSVGVLQWWLLSHVLFNVFLEEIMSDIHYNHESTISICRRHISNLSFAIDIAVDIDLIARTNNELHVHNAEKVK